MCQFPHGTRQKIVQIFRGQKDHAGFPVQQVQKLLLVTPFQFWIVFFKIQIFYQQVCGCFVFVVHCIAVQIPDL